MQVLTPGGDPGWSGPGLGASFTRYVDQMNAFHSFQAAIAACHALAPTYADTDWDAIVSWYDVLLTLEPTDVVRLGRAAAIAERDGADVGLQAVDAITGLGEYPWWHAARAELLSRMGRPSEARSALESAKSHALTDAHVRAMNSRLDHPTQRVTGSGPVDS